MKQAQSKLVTSRRNSSVSAWALALALPLIAPLSLTACGPDQSTNSLSSASQSQAAQDGTATTLEKFQTSLQGTWSRPCLNDATYGHYKEVLAFAGEDDAFAIVIKDFFYSDAACTAATLIESRSLTNIDINSNASGSGWTYTASVATQSYLPQTTQAAATLNSSRTCGYSQWAAGVATDTTNTACNPAGTFLDTLYLTGGNLFRALDEVLSPNVISGTVPQGSPYTRQN